MELSRPRLINASFLIPQERVEAFEEAKIFDGKSFWEVEKEIKWVDC